MKIHILQLWAMRDFIQYFDHHSSKCVPQENKTLIRVVTDYIGKDGEEQPSHI